MKNAVWAKAIKGCADPPRARHFVGLFAGTSAGTALHESSPERARILTALFSGSHAMSNLLLANPAWLEFLLPEALNFARRKQSLLAEVGRWLPPMLEARDYAGALSRLRQFKQREMLRIAARDLARFGNISEITQEISDVADVCLESVWQVCHLQLRERYGLPYHQDAQGRWQPTAGCMLGLGKLGGHELNYSSDVDVIFVYSEEGSVFKSKPQKAASLLRSGSRRRPRNRNRTSSVFDYEHEGDGEDDAKPRPVLTNHQFFNRLGEAIVGEITRLAPEGTLYRIDLRLRPEGDTGPLSRSLAGYENYYAQWGQTWERMMLIKARFVAGDAALAAEFIEMVQPFRYPGSIASGVLREVAAMKDRIENEVVRSGELERNVKLGRGGIREVEFVAQALQLLHAGKQPFLQTAQTLPCLEKLAQYELLSIEDSRLLSQAYRFLREVEHRLQMEDNLQTHTIPARRHAQERLARQMGFGSLKAFEGAHRTHTGNVRRIFHRLLKPEPATAEAPSPFPRQFDGAEAEWKRILAEHSFKEPSKAFGVLREFVEGPGYVHVSPRTSALAFQLLPKLFAMCPTAHSRLKAQDSKPNTLSDPDRVVMRLDSFIGAYGARATLFELWNTHPAIFELLLRLFDCSEFLAELAIRTPDLVDELVTSGRLRQRKSAEETLRDLRHGLEDQDQHLWLRRYHQAELMRIGLRDILGLADFEQYLSELSALAEGCLRYALQAVMRAAGIKSPPFVIIGLGKLGGGEIDYGSDLDIIFVAGAEHKSPARLARLAVEVMDLLSRRTEQGVVFHTDARLRPDGEKGLLVNTLGAYERYYRQRAQLWEIQSLTRARPVAGDARLGEQFQTLAAALTNFKQPSPALAAFTPDWKQKIHRMRMRIEKERTPRGEDDLAIKTGAGGLMDAEFIAQLLCMENGWQEANSLRALERGRAAKVLPGASKLIGNYRQLRRIEGILRRWSYQGETVLPDEPAAYHRVAARCGFAAPEPFRRAVAKCRRTIREVYLKVFEG